MSYYERTYETEYQAAERRRNYVHPLVQSLREAGVENVSEVEREGGPAAWADHVMVDVLEEAHDGYEPGTYVSNTGCCPARLTDVSRALVAWGEARDATFLVGTNEPYRVVQPAEFYAAHDAVEADFVAACEAFEDEHGYAAASDGPCPGECPYCGTVTQYSSDHSCYGTRGEDYTAEMLG